MRHALVALGLGMGMLLLSWGTSAMESRGTAAAARDEIRPEQILPGDSVVVLSYDGQAAHLPGLKGTAAWESLEDTELMDRVFELMGVLVELSGEGNGQILRRAVDHLRAEGTSLGISLGGDGDQPAPFGVLVIHDAAELAADLEPIVMQAMPPGGPQVRMQTISGRKIQRADMSELAPGVELAWWSEGSHLVIAAGMDSVRQTLATIAGDRPALAGQPQWQAMRQSDEFMVTGLGWVDVGAVLGRFGGMVLPPAPSGEVMTVNELLQIPGLDAVDGLFMQMGFEGATTWTKTDVKWRGEPRGLMRLLDQRPLQLSELPPLPAAVTGFSGFRFDAGAALQTMLDVARQLVVKIEPNAAGQFDQGIGMAGVVLGIQPQDLLNGFGDVWCVYSDTAALPIPMGISPALAVSVRDRDVITDGLTALTQAAASFAGENGFEVRPSEKDGVSYWALTIRELPVVPTLMLTDDWFVAGITPVTAQTFAARLQGKLPSWEPDEVVAEGLAELPSEMMSLTYSDPAPAYAQLLQLAPMGMMFLQQSLGEQGVEMPFEIQDLPVPELVTAPLFPNLSVTVRSESGLTSLVRQSVPATPLGDISATAVVPILVALLLPAVQQAREAARRTQSRNNLKMMGLAAHNYHDVYNRFPQGTVDGTDLPPEKRLSWAYSLLPFLDEPALYDQMDRAQAWDSDANALAVATQISVFQNPSQPGRRANPSSGDYLGVTGIGEGSADLPANDRRAGIFGTDRQTRFRDVTDGTSNTMMFIDASEPNVSQFAGGRATLRGFSQKPYFNGPDGIGSPHTGVVQVMFADGSVRAMSVDVDDRIIEAMATKAGGEVISDF